MDIEQTNQLITYLRDHQHVGSGDTPRCSVLAGGVSNRTVLVEFDDGRAWVVKQALAKLRVKVDWFSDPARIHREAMGLRHLNELSPPGTITPLVFEDHEHHMLAMQAVAKPHDNWKTLLLDGMIDMNHVEQFAQLLAAIHARSRNDAKLAEVFDDRSFFESLRLEPYYAYTAGQVAAAGAFLTELINDTRLQRTCIVHGDYSPKNILVHQNKLVLIDHEVIHFGDPAFDVGFSLTHLLSKAHHVVSHRDAFLCAAKHYWLTYLQAGGDSGIEPLAVRHTLACLLARVAGRSTLEYMTDQQRAHQRRIVIDLIVDKSCNIDKLITNFSSRL